MGKGSALLRDKRIWWTAATVVSLAIIIFVLAAVSAPKSSDRTTREKTPSLESESLAERAADALSNGETSTAVALAERALKQDPENTTAARVMETAAEDEPAEVQDDPEPAGNDSGTTDDSSYQRAVSDMSSLLPRSISGWSSGTVVSQKSDAVVTFEPNATSDAARTTVKALVTAHDRGSASKASSFITKVDKRVYSKNVTTVDVGSRDAYFGTDGAKLAVVAFARGRFAFEVIVTAQPGVKPSTLKQVATSIASSLPAAK